jgi:hypothetical protein
MASRNNILYPPKAGLQGKQMANFRTGMIAVAVVAAMAGPQAMAADGALTPGKPAGISQARLHHSPNLLLIGGAAAVAVVGIVVATMSSSNAVCGAAQGCNPITSSTSTTS